MAVHSILPPLLTGAVDEVLRAAGVPHVAHGDADPVAAATAAANDPDARAVIGPFRSRDVAEAIEATAPRGLPMLAPVATWVGITRDDEPGCDDHADHRSTILRLVARDTVVAQRIAQRVKDAGQTALVIAGEHEYGRQLDGQLRMAGLPRGEDGGVIVLAGLAGEPECEEARRRAPLPVIAFDGIQGESFPDQEIELAVVYAPGPTGVAEARRAAEIVLQGETLEGMRALGFDEHGDPLDPEVRFERYEA